MIPGTVAGGASPLTNTLIVMPRRTVAPAAGCVLATVMSPGFAPVNTRFTPSLRSNSLVLAALKSSPATLGTGKPPAGVDGETGGGEETLGLAPFVAEGKPCGTVAPALGLAEGVPTLLPA